MDALLNTKMLLKSFYSDGFSLGMEIFSSGFSRKKLFESLSKMYDFVDTFNQSFHDFVTKNGKKIHCRKGCYWCCHQPVFALTYELEYLNHYVTKNFDHLKLAEIRKRIKAKQQYLQSFEEKKLLNSKFPCPFLENGSCMAYEARPMACRIYLSTNLKSCMKFFHHPENKKSVPELLDFPMKAGRMMNEGFKAALKTNGIKTEEFRIDEWLEIISRETEIC